MGVEEWTNEREHKKDKRHETSRKHVHREGTDEAPC